MNNAHRETSRIRKRFSIAAPAHGAPAVTSAEQLEEAIAAERRELMAHPIYDRIATIDEPICSNWERSINTWGRFLSSMVVRAELPICSMILHSAVTSSRRRVNVSLRFSSPVTRNCVISEFSVVDTMALVNR